MAFKVLWCAVSFGLGDLTVVCAEEIVGMLVDACVTEEESSEAVDVINIVVEEMDCESAFVGGVVGAQDEGC